MIFGRIDYLNLLPFLLFLKRRYPHILARSIRHRGPPSHINRLFLKGKIDAAFISSIHIPRYFGTTDLGIVAHQEVMSVLLLPGNTHQSDQESETSNRLAKLLGCKGQVVIGDKALKIKAQDPNALDLATLWYHEYGLPFVFARLCYNRQGPLVRKMAREFTRNKPPKVPTYIQKAQARKTDLEWAFIALYLKKIHYRIDRRAAKGLKRFLDTSRHYKGVQ